MIDPRRAAALTLILGPLVAVEAVCEVYMSETQAASTIFPGISFEKKVLPLSPEDVKKIEKDSGETVRAKDVTVYRAGGGESVYIDRVLGKHEMITYAVGIGRDGKVAGIEILEYRESYGHEVKRPVWRAQFKGKDLSSPLKLEEDIKNISGATLSSAHITRGVKRVLHTHALVQSRG